MYCPRCNTSMLLDSLTEATFKCPDCNYTEEEVVY